jgi:ubiquitin carboxyl-terminal hydrolase L3
VKTLGINDTWQFVDVYDLSADGLQTIPHPVVAALLLFPLAQSESQILGDVDPESGLYFIRQTIGNACGTIGIIHALCNNSEKLRFDADKHLSKFFGETKDLSPEERGKHLESDTTFGEVHEEVAQEGQTQAPPRDEKVDLHFVAFVHHKGTLYELDGRRDGPVNHGPTTEDSLLEDTAEVVKKFMARDPENLNFTVVALAKA